MAVIIDSRRGRALHSILGALILWLCVIIAQLDIYGFGAMFLGVFAIVFWPRYASYMLSAILIFCIGLFHDLSSGGPAGAWAILYLTLFIMARPREREREKNLWWHYGHAVIWVSVICVGVIILGLMANGTTPEILQLGFEALGTLLLFPVFYAVRTIFRTAFIDTDDYGLA